MKVRSDLGLIWVEDKHLGCIQADAIARKFDLPCAERLVTHLEGKGEVEVPS